MAGWQGIIIKSNIDIIVIFSKFNIMEFWLVVICIGIIFWALGLFAELLKKRAEVKIINSNKARQEIEEKRLQIENLSKRIEEDKINIQNLANEKSKGFPWLAEAYADYYYLRNMEIAQDMDYKSHPAHTSAEKVRNISKERRVIETKFRIAQQIIKYYQNLFPFLEDLLGDAEDEILKQLMAKNITEPIRDETDLEIDPVKIYLSSIPEEEYKKLTKCQKNQLALDRYWSRPNKTKWQLGRDYERYIGYLYEKVGHNVYYQGILEGLEDLGRDLIVKNNEGTIVIQCKRWAQYKKIHEKHINQLFGTMIKYSIDHPNENVSASLFTTTNLSDKAKEFAEFLGINVRENFAFESYPSIKCNVSRKTGERIYHLPFDQQYDRIIIEPEKDECYAETIEEAESMGFRRAWKWKGPEMYQENKSV